MIMQMIMMMQMITIQTIQVYDDNINSSNDYNETLVSNIKINEMLLPIII